MPVNQGAVALPVSLKKLSKRCLTHAVPCLHLAKSRHAPCLFEALASQSNPAGSHTTAFPVPSLLLSWSVPALACWDRQVLKPSSMAKRRLHPVRFASPARPLIARVIRILVFC